MTLKPVVLSKDPLNAEAPWEALRQAHTPIGAFFKRNHFPLPPAEADWRLTVEGGTEGRLEFDLEHLAHFGRRSLEAVLECAGNGRTLLEPQPGGTPWGLGAVSHARWGGVPLSLVLEEAGPPPDAVEVSFEGADGEAEEGRYARSLPLEAALQPGVLLAWEMNGRPLPRQHGGPLRLLVPGWYGMASVKWLRRVAFLSRPFEGPFQTEEYVFRAPGEPSRPVTRIRPRALIVRPLDGQRVGRRLDTQGWAWSGSGPILEVELRLDGAPVEVRLGEARGRYGWRRWQAELDLDAGRHALEVRARDAAGQTQPDQAPWNEGGYENNSPHRIEVEAG